MEMYGIDQLGIQASQVHHNLCAARLVKKSLERGGSDPVLDGRPFGGNGKVYRPISLR